MAQCIVKAIHRLVYCVCFVGMWFIALMMLLTTFDVIGRSFFTYPLPGTFELSKYMLVIIVLLSIAYVQQAKHNVRVTYFADKLSPRNQLVLESIFTLVALTVFSLMVWQGWEGGLNAIRVKSVSDLLRIPSYPFEFLIAVGAFLASLELLISLIVAVKNLIATGANMEGVK